MPRYRFSWENLSAPLLAELCASLGLEDDRSAADALRTTYGARPKPVFVKDAWPVLRDHWLEDDAVSRAQIVAQLRSARLGLSDTPVGTQAEQMTYLRSCHNQQSLRDIVLAQLLSVGGVAAAATVSDGAQAIEPSHLPVPAPAASDDIGPKVVEDLFNALQIDAQWSTTEPRGFDWWAYRLRQRVWADPARESLGDSVVCVHVETDYIKGVRDQSPTYECLSGLNHMAGLSAYVFDPAQGVIRAHSTAYVYAGNRWLERLIKAAAAFQDAEAHASAQKIPQILGEGEPDVTNHPASGSRPQLDDMLHIEENLAGRKEPSPFTSDLFKSVLGMQPRPWLFATGGGAGLTAELAFTGNLTAVEIVSLGKNFNYQDRSVETALLVASGAETNPRLGNGLLLRLTLPLKVDAETAARLANDLNLAETKAWTETHFLGAWCTKGPDLWFVSFAPNLVAKGMTASEQAILVSNLIMSMRVRTQWAKIFLAAKGILKKAPADSGGATTEPFASTPGGAEILAQNIEALAAANKVEPSQVLATIWAQLLSERG